MVIANDHLANTIAANWRLAHEPVTGVTRCATEILRRLPTGVHMLSPARRLAGAAGHAWEQTLLPRLAGNKLIWNPNCTGPLVARRQVITVHDLAPLDHPEWFEKRFSRWYQFLLPRLAERALAVICVSEFSRQRLLERTRVKPERAVVVLNGVDERFRPIPSSAAKETLTSLNLPSRFVLTVGSIEPRKNLSRLLAAWAAAHRRVDSDISLVIAGGTGASHIFSQCNLGLLPPRVRVIGRVNDTLLPALYSAASAFIYPSLYEGFGLPPLEAMACGTPVVASAIPPIEETTNGAAVLVDPQSVEALADGIVRVLTDSDLAARLRQSGRAAASKYSWSETAERTWQLLEKVA